jgi:hypothetical protein
MASSSQKRTTMAKLNREAALRERRQRKQAKRDARKQASAGQLREKPGDDEGQSSPPPQSAPAAHAPELRGDDNRQ